ncbi:hypothetical protein LCGC14_1707480, partial [marine sediment metagenome]
MKASESGFSFQPLMRWRATFCGVQLPPKMPSPDLPAPAVFHLKLHDAFVEIQSSERRL